MKILLGMSGGVDSTFAAYKLLSEGHTVEGAVLKMHEHTEVISARSAAENIGVALHEIDCSELFDSVVKSDFVNEYSRARTPNPCIICNERVKFRVLYDYAMEHGFDAIATGHYARVVRTFDGSEERYAVAMAEDARKDQSYMLYRLPQEILSRLSLPLAGMTKDEVRESARAGQVFAADRKDSQEICFLPDGNHAEYVESVVGKCYPGNFIDEEGNILGKHNGIIRYTVGQRKGLGISLGERMFVTRITPEDNTVTLASSVKGESTVRITDIAFSGIARPGEQRTLSVQVRLRYTAPLLDATAYISEDGSARLEFDEAVKAAPGQSAVLYADGVVLCGGFIA